MKDDKQHVFLYITGRYETSHALHSFAAGDLVLCNVRDTNQYYCCISVMVVLLLLYMWCVLQMWKYTIPEMHKGLTLSDVRTGEGWLVSMIF
jgi:hypothetical protein